MDRLLTDLRFAARLLYRSPAFTATAVAVLALGIGASTAIYSVVDHILLRPLPLPGSERMVRICETHPSMRDWCGVSMVQVGDWREQAGSFEAIGFARRQGFTTRTAGGDALGLVGAYADPGFFQALGFRARLGRLFDARDVLPAGDPRALVLSHRAWQAHFGARPDVIGRRILVDTEPFEIVGVLPEWARAPRFEDVDAWAAPSWDATDPGHRDWRGFMGFGRLAEGALLSTAGADLAVIQDALGAAYPEAVGGWGVELRPLKEDVVGSARTLLLLFLGAVGAVLVIVCVNTAGLMLARATGRQRELVVRSALGADTRRLGRQLLTESGLLALLGGAGGILVAYWTTDLFLALAPPGIPRIDEVTVDGRVLAFALAVTALTGLLVGVAPAWRARAVDLSGALRESRAGDGGRTAARARRALVVTELALAVVLVAGAGVLLRSFAGLADWESGIDTEHVVTFFEVYSPGRYPEAEQVRALLRHTEAELAGLPGVRSVATGSTLPLHGWGDGASPFLIDGRAEWTLRDAPSVLWVEAGPGYFETLGIPVRRGRAFRESDEEGSAPVMVINEAMARRYWPGADPLGSRVRLPEQGREGEIIGVVGDVPPFYAGEPVEPAVYLSNRQHTRWGHTFIMRTEGDPALVLGPVRGVLEAIDPDLGARYARTLEEVVQQNLVRPRFNVMLVGMLALLALVLSATGIYGVVAHGVGLRRQEIGIRMALGARREQVLEGILREGLALAAVGLGIGLLLALVTNRLLAGLVYGVSPTDPLALLGTAAVLAATGVLAALAPARRASRTSPMTVLREQ